MRSIEMDSGGLLVRKWAAGTILKVHWDWLECELACWGDNMIDRGCGGQCGRGLVWLGLCDWTYREDEIIWFLLAFAAVGLMGCVGVEILVCEGGGSRRRFGVWIVWLLGNFELKRKPSTPRLKLYRVVCEEGKVFGANRLVVVFRRVLRHLPQIINRQLRELQICTVLTGIVYVCWWDPWVVFFALKIFKN